ncbi:hypothetical protein [Maribacter sp. 2-571]|uniref:hypothetical protein n=1 Tax=Maribacter sp. 2-571 TaxID=3417569 RepID=UPI003D35593F
MKKNIIISEGNRSLWQLLIAATCYTMAILFFYQFFSKVDLFAPSKKVKSAVSVLEVALFLLVGGIGFSMVRDIHFDFKKGCYKEVFGVGPFKFGKWKAFKALKYVAVFKNNKGEFEVNLWYDHNKHFNIMLFANGDEAMKDAKTFAKQLGIKLYDARVANKGKWIEDVRE